MNKKTDAKLDILGVVVTSKSKVQVLEEIWRILATRQSEKLTIVTTPNPEQVVQASKDDTFRHILNRSEYSVPDGVGLVWAAKLLKGVKIDKIPGVELAEELVGKTWESGGKVAVLGGKPGVAARALENQKSKIKKQNDKLECKNLALSGSADVETETETERREVLEEIARFKPDLLLVAYGAPRQEKWIWDNREELAKAGVKVSMVVGGAVDMWANEVKRAPQVVRATGFEWLWRLVQGPWRWRRQLRLVEFVGMVIRSSIVDRRS